LFYAHFDKFHANDLVRTDEHGDKKDWDPYNPRQIRYDLNGRGSSDCGSGIYAPFVAAKAI
jgi:acetylornithine deacetylase/succinyl-diaminopimelate desuccinylase-like protein